MAYNTATFSLEYEQSTQISLGHRSRSGRVAHLDGERRYRRCFKVNGDDAGGIVHRAIHTVACETAKAVVEGKHVLVAEVQVGVESNNRDGIGHDARLQIDRVRVAIIVADELVDLLSFQVFVERRLVRYQRAFVHLDGDSPEQREVVFHLAVLFSIGRTDLTFSWIDRRHALAAGVNARVLWE